MRTDEEIIERLKEIDEKGEDFLGTRRAELVHMLSAGQARPFLKMDVDPGDWKRGERDRESILKRMLDYMPFAWNKAINCRGISAGRSMEHYLEWIWLLGDDPGFLEEYEFYGKDNLVKVCEKYGWDATQWDDGIRVNSESELEE